MSFGPVLFISIGKIVLTLFRDPETAAFFAAIKVAWRCNVLSSIRRALDHRTMRRILITLFQSQKKERTVSKTLKYFPGRKISRKGIDRLIVMNWSFKDSMNTAVFTSSRILSGDDWVYYVSHDQDDGAWQFHPYSGRTPEEDARVVSLKEIVEIEPRISELADLPLGWHAWRQEKEEVWQKAPQEVE